MMDAKRSFTVEEVMTSGDLIGVILSHIHGEGIKFWLFLSLVSNGWYNTISRMRTIRIDCPMKKDNGLASRFKWIERVESMYAFHIEQFPNMKELEIDYPPHDYWRTNLDQFIHLTSLTVHKKCDVRGIA